MSKLDLVHGEVFYANSESKVRIWKAEEQTEGLKVAVKEYTMIDIKTGNQALREAMAMSRLNHPSIVTIYDFYLDQTPAGLLTINIVMELMEEDLSKAIERRYCEQNPWEEADIWGVMRKLVFALAFTERQNISHRDLKPQNIFICGNEVKIGDFGASSYSFSPHTSMHSIQGSPLYLSPELKSAFLQFIQTNQRNTAYDPVKSDVYSLGMTILHMALLRLPLALASLVNLEENTRAELAGLDRYQGLQPWIASMLAINPEARMTFVSLEEYICKAETGSIQRINSPVFTSNPQPAREEAANCNNCGKPVSPWTSHEIYHSDFRDLFSQFCSPACLDKALDIFPKSQCVRCKLPIAGEALDCGHMMHSLCKQLIDQGQTPDYCLNCPHQSPSLKRQLSHPAPEEVPEPVRRSGSKVLYG